MLSKIRITLGFITIAALFGWWSMHKPYSPADSLSRVYYPAFEVQGIDSISGKNLALAVRTWPGITAAAYTPQSGLLSISCIEGTDEPALIQQLQYQADAPVTKKIFTAPAGPRCPVPIELIHRLPAYMLYIGLVCSCMFLFTFFPFLYKK